MTYHVGRSEPSTRARLVRSVREACAAAALKPGSSFRARIRHRLWQELGRGPGVRLQRTRGSGHNWGISADLLELRRVAWAAPSPGTPPYAVLAAARRRSTALPGNCWRQESSGRCSLTAGGGRGGAGGRAGAATQYGAWCSGPQQPRYRCQHQPISHSQPVWGPGGSTRCRSPRTPAWPPAAAGLRDPRGRPPRARAAGAAALPRGVMVPAPPPPVLSRAR
jgi:hypothetical protein